MPSTTKRGGYYKLRTKEMYESLGYYVELTEFTTTRYIPGGRMVFVKKDVLGSDGIALNRKEIIFWNAKHATSGASKNTQLCDARKEYDKFPFPPAVKRQIVMWQPRKKPEVIDV